MSPDLKLLPGHHHPHISEYKELDRPQTSWGLGFQCGKGDSLRRHFILKNPLTADMDSTFGD